MSWRIRENGKKINIFDKVSSIKSELKQIIPEIEENRVLIQMLAHCRSYYEGNLYYGRRTQDPEIKKQRKEKKLTNTEKIVYDYLLKTNLNPSTTYRWFLATRVPRDIKDKLSKGQISYRKAIEISNNRRKITESNKGLLLMEEIREIINSL